MNPENHRSSDVRRLHIDRRAAQLVERAEGDGDDLLNTTEVSEWLGVSTQFLEIGRHRGYGPPFIRLTPRLIRYRRGDVLDWLRERQHRRTLEYTGVGVASEEVSQ